MGFQASLEFLRLPRPTVVVASLWLGLLAALAAGPSASVKGDFVFCVSVDAWPPSNLSRKAVVGRFCSLSYLASARRSGDNGCTADKPCLK